MSNISIVHGSFTLTRHYPAPPDRLFRAWSDKDELARWAAPASDWTFTSEQFDFRVGGREISKFGPKDQEPYVVNSRFDRIDPNAAIVSAFSVSQGDQQISSSVLSVEFAPGDGGTKLVLTEQSAFFDGLETPQMRRSGTEVQLDQLQAYLSKQDA